MGGDRPALGILLMAAFCCLVPIADALAKILGATLPLALLLLVRFGAQTLIFGPVALLRGEARGLPGWAWRLMAWRTAFHMAGLAFMFAALRVLPLAEAIAIAFVMPFLLLLAGRIFLDEEVGARRLGACAVGFAGTLLVMQPSFAEVGAAVLLPLGVAVAFAAFMLITRRLAPHCGASLLQGATGLMATAVLLLAMTLGADLHVELGWGAPDAREIRLLALMGVLGAGAHLLMTLSLRFAPAATLAPMQYLEIPMATLTGWIVFGALPDGLAALGIAITIAAGLYIVLRERRLARDRRLALDAIAAEG